MIYAVKQQYDQAVAEGERAIALDPNNADCYARQAEVLNVTGRPEEALQAMRQAMRLNPRYPFFYATNLGMSYRMTGRYAEAIATLKEAVSRNPNDIGAYLNLASSYLGQWGTQQGGDEQTLTQALAAAQRVIALNDSIPGGHSLLGAVYLWQKQYEQAIAEMERAIAVDPNDPWGYVGLAAALGLIGRPEEGLQRVEQARHYKPYIADETLADIGAAYSLAGKPEEAIAPLKLFLSRYPNILRAHLILAAIYSELGQAAEARAEAAEVLRRNPNFSLDVHRQRMPIKDPAVLERHIAALRKAGLK
jgi:adenylate cyclase